MDTAQAIIVTIAVLHNIARQFGDDEPKVTNEQGHIMNLTLIDQQLLLTMNNQGGNQPVHRNRFLNYFSTLL